MAHAILPLTDAIRTMPSLFSSASRMVISLPLTLTLNGGFRVFAGLDATGACLSPLGGETGSRTGNRKFCWRERPRVEVVRMMIRALIHMVGCRLTAAEEIMRARLLQSPSYLEF